MNLHGWDNEIAEWLVRYGMAWVNEGEAFGSGILYIAMYSAGLLERDYVDPNDAYPSFRLKPEALEELNERIR